MINTETATVRVTRRFNHAAERVFDAWLDPSRLGKWLFATATGEMTQVEVDARVGGNFNITERRGGEEVPHLGTYIEIDRPRRLVFDVTVEKYVQHAERVTIEIVPLDTGCELTLVHKMNLRKDVTPDMLHTGWTMVLDGLARTLVGSDSKTESINPTSDNDNPTARVIRAFKASPERVFDAWLDPELLGQWMFGSNVREEEILHLKVNPMVGGSFSFHVRRGDAEIDHIGEYLEIDRPRRLVFTWGVRQDEGTAFSRVEVEIVPFAGGCELKISHEMGAKWADFVERAKGSWQLMADALARVLE